MSTISVLVATAEREVYRGEADFLTAPGAAGELGIMPKHTPLLSALNAGELYIRQGEETDEVFISGGFMEVQPDCITILADTAERASDVDEAAALEAERKAQEVIDSNDGGFDYARAASELSIASARLAFIRKRKKH